MTLYQGWTKEISNEERAANRARALIEIERDAKRAACPHPIASVVVDVAGTLRVVGGNLYDDRHDRLICTACGEELPPVFGSAEWFAQVEEIPF